MGDRWNIHNDEIEARRYQTETPPWRRLVDKAMEFAFVVGVPAAILALWIYGSER